MLGISRTPELAGQARRGLAARSSAHVDRYPASHKRGLPTGLAQPLVNRMGIYRIDSTVMADAGNLVHDTKSLDAIHLASALQLKNPFFPDIMLVSHDANVLSAGGALSLSVFDPLK